VDCDVVMHTAKTIWLF